MARKRARADDGLSPADVLPVRAAREHEPGERRSRALRPVYVVLAALVLLAATLTLFFPTLDPIQKFGPNLATEAFGILFTLVFVHRFLAQQDRARRLRSSIGALRKGSRALEQLTRTWVALVKGSQRHVPTTQPRTLRELFAPHMTEELCWADPAARRLAEDGTEESWLRWAARELTHAQDVLNTVVMTYGSALDPAYVEALDDVVDDPFVRLVVELATDESVDARVWRQKLKGARAHREAHFDLLLRVLALHNGLASEAATVRARGSRPRSGTLGVELPRDHDLRAPATLESAWWRAAPTPGALCAERDGAGR